MAAKPALLQWTPIAPDTTAPAAVAALALEIQVGQLILTWSNPADADFTGVTIRRSTTEFPATPSDGQLVYEGTKTTFSDGLVMDGATYNFSVFAHDSVPNYSSAAQVHILAGLATTIETCTICHAPDRTVGHNVMHGLEVHYAEPWPTGWRWETAATP